MIISIITINYSDLAGLKKTMASVLDQTFKGIEYIIIDGGSTDGSAKYIEQHSEKLSYWISEPDKGIYNAMNKGITQATGEYILFLNSADVLYNNTVIEEVSKRVNDHLDIYYGNLNFCYPNKSYIAVYPDQLSFSYFYKKTLPHPATFISKKLFDTVFHFNENLKIVSDWEFFICAICKHNASYKYLDFTISNFDCSGISSAPENKDAMHQERKQCLEKHFPLFTDDYDELLNNRNFTKSIRYKILVALESSAIAKKVNTKILIVLLKIFKGKSPKDLKY